MLPLIPSAVTPWFTAFKAYSAMNQSSLSPDFLKQSRHTNLNELPTVEFVSSKPKLGENRDTYLGEKVVNENE
jgi:hypothetical protein